MAFALSVCFFIPSTCFAGLPFRTDDPDPVEYRHWEFYVASQASWDDAGASGTAAFGEVNYGITKWMHIHVNVPLNFYRPRGGNAAYGPGNIEFGCKCRFVNEHGIFPEIGTFPAIEIPSGNADKDLTAGNVQLFIPLWFQKRLGAWATDCGAGYLADIASNPVNSLFLGWQIQRDISEFITLGAELFGTVIPSERSENEMAFNIGTIMNFNDNYHLLVSAGRDIVGKNHFFLLAVYQLTFGPCSK